MVQQSFCIWINYWNTWNACYVFHSLVWKKIRWNEKCFNFCKCNCCFIKSNNVLFGFEGSSFYIMAVLFAIMNIPTSMMGIASTALWGDSLDLIELTTGQRNEGTVFAFQNFIAKISGSLSALMNGITLAILKFSPEAMANGAPLSETFIKYSWPIFALGPALGALLQFIPTFMLKFNNKDRDKITKALAEKETKRKRKRW